MKTITLILIFTFVCVQVADGAEICPTENCLEVEQCEEIVKSSTICANGLTCCSIVKTEFRNNCRHHGGICVSRCSAALSVPPEQATDCHSYEKCCILT